jgi:predicted  nucleic acid-binding Zn-ribbon protein
LEQRYFKFEGEQKELTNEIEKNTEDIEDLTKKLTRIDNEIIGRESGIREQRAFYDKL